MNRFLTCVAIFLAASHAFAADPLPEIKIDGNGKWTVPLRSWFSIDLFSEADAFAFLGEVVAMGPAPRAAAPGELASGGHRKAEIKVLELLSKDAPASFADIKILDVEGAGGLKVGDRLVVLIDREPYEKQFVINFHDAETALGILLRPGSKLSEADEEVLLDFFRGSKFGVADLSPAQREVWQKIDAKGLAAEAEKQAEMARQSGRD